MPLLTSTRQFIEPNFSHSRKKYLLIDASHKTLDHSTLHIKFPERI